MLVPFLPSTLLTLRAAGPRGRVRRPEGRTAKRERQRGEAHGPEGDERREKIPREGEFTLRTDP